MTRNRFLFAAAALVMAFALTGCLPTTPVPTSAYSQLRVGMTEFEVNNVLGLPAGALKVTDEGPDPFTLPGDPINPWYIHTERNLRYDGKNGSCTQVIKVQLKNWNGGAPQQPHIHLDAFRVSNFSVTNSAGCGTVIK